MARAARWASGLSRSMRSMNASRRLPGAAPATVKPGGQQLLGEEWIALAAGVEAIDQGFVGIGVEDVRQDLAQFIPVERFELQRPRRPEAVKLHEQRTKRMTAMELVGAVAEQDEHRLVTEAPGEEGDEGAGRLVGPVHVLENQRDGRALGQELEQLEQSFEEPQLGRWIVDRRRVARVGQPWKQGRQLRAASAAELIERRVMGAYQGAQGAGQRGVGQLAVALLDRLATEHQYLALREQALKLSDQTRLADAGISAKEQQRRLSVARCLSRLFELTKLRGPPDKSIAGQPAAHA